MRYKLKFTSTAGQQLDKLENEPAMEGVLEQVRKTLGYLETNLRAKSLQTHEFSFLTRRFGQKIFEAYVQQNTPAAFRIFWHYGPDEKEKSGERTAVITIITIVRHE